MTRLMGSSQTVTDAHFRPMTSLIRGNIKANPIALSDRVAVISYSPRTKIHQKVRQNNPLQAHKVVEILPDGDERSGYD